MEHGGLSSQATKATAVNGKDRKAIVLTEGD